MGFFWNGGFEILFFLMFGLFFVVFVITLFQGLRRWNRNNHAPRLTVDATVVTKRTQVSSHRHHRDTGMDHISHTSYYFVTFQVESGDRMELAVESMDYGMLVEGDRGKLSFQGTRFLGFQRDTHR